MTHDSTPLNLKDTVNLPQTDFPIRAGLQTVEPARLSSWAQNKIYEKSLAQQATFTQTFTLHDGPPYPNGNIHLGHALNKVLKDIIVRYKVMTGHNSTYIPGWDCHGLPIETQVLKELKSQGVTDPLADPDAFRKRCAEFARRYVDMQREDFKRLGIWGRWEEPYLTLNPGYEAKVDEAFQQLKDNGLIFRGAKPIHWCTHCETALAEAEIEYADHKSPSVYVAFLDRTETENSGVPTSLVVWTTTPWTLPANVAVAAHPDLDYCCVESNGKRYIGAKALREKWEALIGLENTQEIWTLTGRDLVQHQLSHPFENPAQSNLPARPLILADFVTQDDGTGFVHIAPGHGQDDHQAGLANNLPVVMPVDPKGVFTAEANFPTLNLSLEGQKITDANKTIGQWMESQGTLLKLKFITHSYPHCWRCKNPVIFRATPQWFVAVDKPMNSNGKTLRETALEQIKATQWFPDWGENRITSMVTNRPDWCISRQRIWGIPIPDGGGDILDVWFESGASFKSVLPQLLSHAPKTSVLTADLYLEGSDQHRGWFQSSLLIGCGTQNKAPYKAVLTHGFLIDDKGRKMSKSLGNVVAPEQVIRDFGADVLRWWVACADFKNDLAISQNILKQCADHFAKVRNTIRFGLSNLYDFDPTQHLKPYSELNTLDQWALTELNTLIEKAHHFYTTYTFHQATTAIHEFCTVTLSALYLDMVKDRLYCGTPDSPQRRSTQTALYHITDTLIRLLAPILVFTAEEAYAHFNAPQKPQSIHLTPLPQVNPDWQNPGLQATFTTLLAQREDLYRHLEPLRADKTIKSFLEASVSLPAPLTGLPESEWTSFLIVSQVTLTPGSPITVGKTTLEKCQRCWRHTPLINAALCERCQDCVAQLRI